MKLTEQNLNSGRVFSYSDTKSHSSPHFLVNPHHSMRFLLSFPGLVRLRIQVAGRHFVFEHVLQQQRRSLEEGIVPAFGFPDPFPFPETCCCCLFDVSDSL